jgi:formylglycine-generating enzyme required for sulfatase activity
MVDQVARDRGVDILADVTLSKSLLSDYAKGEYKKERRLVLQALEAGYYRRLRDSKERALTIRILIRDFQEDYSIRQDAAEQTIDVLAALFGGRVEQIPPAPAPQPVPTPLPSAAMLDGFVLVAAGTFMMGSPVSEVKRINNEVQHKVTISKPFYMGKYEVTQKEWAAVMRTNPSKFKGDNLPVEMVSWYDAIAYCNKRSIKERLTPAYTVSGTNVSCNWSANGYRLPTEAEWEYAARGGSGAGYQVYAGSNSVDSVGWYDDNSGSKTHPVGTKAANSLGIHDMSGNVWEWCWDWKGDYPTSPQTDPMGASSDLKRVIRGGGWLDDDQALRSAYRDYDLPSRYDDYLGFRLLRPSL